MDQNDRHHRGRRLIDYRFGCYVNFESQECVCFEARDKPLKDRQGVAILYTSFAVLPRWKTLKTSLANMKYPQNTVCGSSLKLTDSLERPVNLRTFDILLHLGLFNARGSSIVTAMV